MSDQTPVYGPYSPIRQAGDLYYVSGQVGLEPQTKTAHPDVQKQTAQVLANLTSALAQEHLTMNDVIKTTIYLTDMADFAAVNEEYLKHFATPRPARSTIGVKELPRLGGDVPLLVEIEAIAARGTA
ncbi:MAG: endoribonuclease [Patescibacteria group bacterium]|nr:endoribonuclease [Patescibacteria group bacterium]